MQISLLHQPLGQKSTHTGAQGPPENCLDKLETDVAIYVNVHCVYSNAIQLINFDINYRVWNTIRMLSVASIPTFPG